MAGAGFRLSLILNAVGCEVATSGIEIHSIAKGVSLFSWALKQLGQALQAPDAVYSHEAINTANEIAGQSKLVFDEIEAMLDKVQNKSGHGVHGAPTLQQKFKLCFKKHRVTYLLAQLESLKLSLAVMLNILQLGKYLAWTSRNDQPAEVEMKTDLIQQERAETQNMVVVRYWSMHRLDRLYDIAAREDMEDRNEELSHMSHETHPQPRPDRPQLTLDVPPASLPPPLKRLPIISLGELDNSLNAIRESPRDMVRVSGMVIDPLLDRWTRWRDVQQHREALRAGRYNPQVYDAYDSDNASRSSKDDFESVDSRGYYLEGSTLDWRQPHSEAARRQYAQLRRQYSGYQPSVDSDAEDHDRDLKLRKNKKPPTHHVIDSSDESEAENPTLPSRRSSGGSTRERKVRIKDPPSDHSRPLVPEPAKPVNNRHTSSGTVNGTQKAPRSPMGNRPMPTPHQNSYHHSISSPLPPTHTGPYTPPLPGGPPSPYIAPQGQPYAPRYFPPGPSSQRIPRPHSRPGSQDGTRSPSRHHHSQPLTQAQIDQRLKKEAEEKSHRNLRKGATRGILGAGAVAGFLEALEGLSL